MPRISTTDLHTKLRDQLTAAARAADSDGDGKLTAAERRALPRHVKAAITALQPNTTTVDIDRFASSFTTAARADIARADRNGDGVLSTTEQRNLPAHLRSALNALGRALTTPDTPVTPSTNAPFGIDGTVPASRVTLKTVLNQGLETPTACAFNPHDGSLWIVNRGDDSSVVITDPGTPNARASKFFDDSAHFMNNPMAIAFSPVRNEFATVQDTDNDYNGHAAGNHFMGPTLFTADLDVYEGGTNSHLDMLHHSPNAVGIVAGARPSSLSSDTREYWVFNGESGAIDRYRFHQPHALGAHDHSDGETFRYADGELSRVPGVPGHMVLDETTGKLYVADTGNGRIASLDTRTSTAGARDITGHHDETPLKRVGGTHVSSVTRADAGLQKPSGLVLHQGMLIVGDYATGHIKVFSRSGELKGDLNTGLGRNTLTGLAVSPEGKLYALDSARGRLLEVHVDR